MTDQERALNKKLAESPLILTLRPSARKRKFTNYSTFVRFVEGEKVFWQRIVNEQTRPVYQSFHPLTLAIAETKNATASLETNVNECLRYLRVAISHLQSFQLFSDTAEGQFVGQQMDIHYDRASGALYFLQAKEYGSAISGASQEAFRGYLEAFFRFQANPRKWAENEAAAITSQREGVERVFAEIQDHFTKLVDELSQRSANVSAQFDTQSLELNSFRDQWKQEIETLHKTTVDRIGDLEKLYGEKLRLKGPAEYWQGLTRRYRNSGVLWSIISGILVIAGSVAGIVGLEFFQQAVKAGQTLAPGSTTLTTEWSHILPVTIVFGVIISVWVFVIRTTVRLALSGFHLVRDAVEREQLSHYYLALIAQDKTLEKDAQNIVLQSLFSRADTGILKGDSSPTMPGNVAEILKNLRG